jgi:hypothetical protein
LVARAVRRLRRVTVREIGLALVAWRWVVDAQVSLRTRPFRTVYERFERQRLGQSRPPDRAAPTATELAIAVRRASRLVPGATCLPQALATRAMLTRRGIVSELRIGVARDARGDVQAHAWVEVAGRVVIGNLPDLARYQRLASVPAGNP